MAGNFWFAEYDPDPPGGNSYCWFPVIQLGDGLSMSGNTYFATERACEEFIRDEILGATTQFQAIPNAQD